MTYVKNCFRRKTNGTFSIQPPNIFLQKYVPEVHAHVGFRSDPEDMCPGLNYIKLHGRCFAAYTFFSGNPIQTRKFNKTNNLSFLLDLRVDMPKYSMLCCTETEI